MGEKFIVSGGIPRKLSEFLSAGKKLKRAEIAEIDFQKQIYTPKLSYVTPPEYTFDNMPSIGFTTMTVTEEEILLGVSTEVLFVDRKDYSVRSKLNHPLFHDIHHVAQHDDKLYVVNTGLDALMEFDMKGNLLKVTNTLGKEAFHKFSKDENLNKVVSTKPHESHPNYVFSINGEIWVTRFQQKDAICVNDLSKRMDIGLGFPHDGLVKGDHVYFTTVNGYVVVFNKNTLKKEAEIDLNASNIRENTPLGWCRGLYVDTDHFYVGYTQLRTTKMTENLGWVKAMIREKKVIDKPAPTRIEKYSLSGDYISEYVLPSTGIYTIFGIHKI